MPEPQPVIPTRTPAATSADDTILPFQVEALDLCATNVLVIAGRGWSNGLIGPVASRLVDTYRKPSILIAHDGDTGRGSARTFGDFDLIKGLVSWRDLLERFGGHKKAAGFDLQLVNFLAFQEGIARFAADCLTPDADDDRIEIDGGRHPVVEVTLEHEGFIPNDCRLDCDERQILIITGPNMGGKSTYLRQVALIVLMAQIGSFVPADSACIGLVDRIFTRVGAQDDIAAGQSTFMVEMIETANILNHATRRSLLILDEVGRGTSTYDGLAIARAVLEHIHDRIGARTLFATHYHELTALADRLPRIHNVHVTVAEDEGDVIFLHHGAPGGADRSYGIHVARLAGLPGDVTRRAEDVLHDLEALAQNGHRSRKKRALQIPLFGEGPDGLASQVLDDLLSLDLPNLTPLEALARLNGLQEKGRGSG